MWTMKVVLPSLFVATRSQSNPNVEVGGIPRGIKALRPLKAEEVAVQVPVKEAMNLGTTSTAAEAAVVLLREKYRKRRRRFDNYLKDLPEDIVNIYTCTAEDLKYLPTDELKILAETRINWTQHVFRTRARPALFGGKQIEEEEFRWATAVVASRTLSIAAPNGDVVKYLIPFLDMANHDERSKHKVVLAADGNEFRLVCGEAVPSGEEIRINYGSLAMDEAAMYYGFIPDTAKKRLCAVDAFGWTQDEQPPFGRPALPTDRSFSDELDRLEARLLAARNEYRPVLPTDTMSQAATLFGTLANERIKALEKAVKSLKLAIEKTEL